MRKLLPVFPVKVLAEENCACMRGYRKNIFSSGELNEKTSSGFSGKSSGGRKPRIYDLDVILAVGYRVNSKQSIEFGG